MPFRSKAQTRMCKYCQLPAVKHIQRCGRFKGYYRTCGSTNCLRQQYSDPVVNEHKRFKGRAVCDKCKSVYDTTSARQKWCKVCAPDRESRRILQRYGLSNSEYKEKLSSQNGVCKLCKIEIADCVDHNHDTGEIRALLCNRCNVGLHYIENKDFKQKAEVYLNSFC